MRSVYAPSQLSVDPPPAIIHPFLSCVFIFFFCDKGTNVFLFGGKRIFLKK